MTVMSQEGVRSTPRDAQVLRWLGEQYGAPLDVFGLLLERYGGQPLTPATRRTLTRTHAGRLERLGYAGRRWSAGQRWIVPTPAGLRAAALPFEAWEPVEWKLRHTGMVGRLRLFLEDRYPDARWESERWVRHRFREEGVRGVRIPDGILHQPSEASIGVELELHRKTRDRYPAILHGISATLDEVIWFVPPGDVGWLRQVLDDVGLAARPIHRVVPIPEGLEP